MSSFRNVVIVAAGLVALAGCATPDVYLTISKMPSDSVHAQEWTLTKISVSQKANIIFANTADETLAIRVVGGRGLVDDNGNSVAGFDIPRVGHLNRVEQRTKVDKNLPLGTEFKYTAQIGTSQIEDPIIIIERK